MTKKETSKTTEVENKNNTNTKTKTFDFMKKIHKNDQ